MNAQEVSNALRSLQNPSKAQFLSRFFKTGKGEYADGDTFLGLTVPVSRTIVRKYKDLPLEEIQKLLQSKYHEERLVALLMLVEKFKRIPNERDSIYKVYLANTMYINNWDLVDLSAPHIVGGYLSSKKDRSILQRLAKSESLWEKRISILATLNFIVKDKEYKDTFEISELLLLDNHDLIHKAVGWMLREVGKRISEEKEEEFLKKHYRVMPRTMLRYSIERFSEQKRQEYLKGLV